MAKYSINNRMSGTQQALTTTYKTLANVVGATTFRARLWEASFGSDGAPNATDCQVVWDIATKDASTAGTVSAVITPQKTNPADRAATLVANGNYTAEPTVFTPYMTFALNQRASQRWWAADQDSAIVMAATALLGLGIRALSPTYASNGLANLVYEEV